MRHRAVGCTALSGLIGGRDVCRSGAAATAASPAGTGGGSGRSCQAMPMANTIEAAMPNTAGQRGRVRCVRGARRGSSIGRRCVHGSARRGQDGGVQRGRRGLFDATAEQAGQLAFFRRQRFVSVHAFNPARSLSIA
jgi:hypothetical protein